MQFSQPPVTSSLLRPNTLLSTLFSSTLNQCSSLKVKDQVSYPHKTTVKNYSVVHFKLYVFSQHMERQRILNCMVSFPK
jgi:hypothetical protein